ncbi:MAG: hypothetical protein E7662_04490 [Ruminococcaceae bacterium]|nr:hypothetical protein [Oscillospiraceae bacterium]
MIQLMRKQIFPEKLEILYNRPFSAESIAEDFEIKGGKWHVDADGWLIGENRECSAAMVMSKAEYFGDVLIEFDAATVLPATRDINVTWHGEWDEEKNCRGTAYVMGVEGWWEGMIGFERSPDYQFVAATKMFDFEPGRVYHITVGNVGNTLFLAVDGKLGLQIRDPDPIDVNAYGRIGFEAFCTRVKYKNLTVRRAEWISGGGQYYPEF